MKYISGNSLRLPKRKKDSKKGDNGKVLVIGGSEQYVGALALAGMAALRSGADWVTVIAPEKVGWAVNCLSPDLVVQKYKSAYFRKKHVSHFLAAESKYDVVLLGNGIGRKSDKFVRSYAKQSKKPMVIDADAIRALSLEDVNNSIITPHKKEFATLMKNSQVSSGEVLQKSLRNNVIILKGKTDQIMYKGEILYNKTGNAGMTKAGTGDVLAGLAAGFYAQAKNALEAAKLAAYYNGLIGDILLKRKKGFTYLASDMVNEIKRVCN
ncbi:NAD(P)H-hydrate dehydratase [Candidatus Woesearchaeota archaeon]|nr:NAD(P)H-hydrate dehydratase [Candidatus Woesearchaeota archaeon]